MFMRVVSRVRCVTLNFKVGLFIKGRFFTAFTARKDLTRFIERLSFFPLKKSRKFHKRSSNIQSSHNCYKVAIKFSSTMYSGAL